MGLNEIISTAKRGVAVLALAGALYTTDAQAERNRPARVGPVTQETVANVTVDPTNNERFMAQLADNFRAQVPRTEGYKWGWEVKVQQYCPDLYSIKVENEEWPECPTGPDPTRLLTTYWRFDNACAPGVVGVRDDAHTAFVSSQLDIDFMELYSRKLPSAAINNLRGDVTEPFPYAAKRAVRLGNAGEMGLNTAEIESVCASPLIVEEQKQMNAWMRTERNPKTILTIRPIGIGTNDRGLYELVSYHVDDNNEEHRMLTATFDYGTGELTRVDAESQLKQQCSDAGIYSKIYAWLPVFNAEGKLIGENKKYGIDNCVNGGAGGKSVLYIPELENAFFGVNYWNP